MAEKKTALRRLYVMEEVAFGTDPDADGSDYKYLHAFDIGLPKIGKVAIPFPAQNDRLTVSPPDLGGGTGSFDFKLALRASGIPSAPPSTPAVATEADVLLKHVLGTVTRGQTTAVNAGNASTTSILVTSSTGFVVGMIVQVSALSSYHYVTAIPDGTHVTIAPACASAPTTGNVVAPNFYSPADTGHKSLAFVYGLDDVLYTLLGAKMSAKIEGFAANGRPTLACSVEFTRYGTAAKASLPAANDLFPTVKPPIVKGAYTWVDGVATRNAGFEMDFGVGSEFVTSVLDPDNRDGFEVTKREPSAALEAWYAASWLTDFSGEGDKVVAIAFGNTLNGGGLWIPKGRFGEPEPADRAGMYGYKIPIGVYDNGSSPEFGLSLF